MVKIYQLWEQGVAGLNDRRADEHRELANHQNLPRRGPHPSWIERSEINLTANVQEVLDLEVW